MYWSQHSSVGSELSSDVLQANPPRPFAPRFAGEPPHHHLAVQNGRANQAGSATDKPSETKAFHPAAVDPLPRVRPHSQGLPLRHGPFDGGTRGRKLLIKRALDIAGASAALLILAPVLLVLALVVRLDSAGPAIFRQERVGRFGRVFTIIKFRTMVDGAEELRAGLEYRNEAADHLFKLHEDPRITAAGRWMRKYSLDELPQFWNVLRGEMSMVGPRPPLVGEVAGYEQPAYDRLLVKPGITGLWQVNGRSDLDWDETVRLDLYYVQNWTLGGDILILLKTFQAVHNATGAY